MSSKPSIAVRVTEEMDDRIEEFSDQESLSQSDAVRKLIRWGLEKEAQEESLELQVQELRERVNELEEMKEKIEELEGDNSGWLIF